ncbi:hypothetical protein M378DRAFT_173975, partial [Amanita muscaria Koide BX008]
MGANLKGSQIADDFGTRLDDFISFISNLSSSSFVRKISASIEQRHGAICM